MCFWLQHLAVSTELESRSIDGATAKCGGPGPIPRHLQTHHVRPKHLRNRHGPVLKALRRLEGLGRPNYKDCGRAPNQVSAPILPEVVWLWQMGSSHHRKPRKSSSRVAFWGPQFGFKGCVLYVYQTQLCSWQVGPSQETKRVRAARAELVTCPSGL